MGIGPQIAAVTAALDLSLVRLLRGAMAAADKQGGGPLGTSAGGLQPGPRPVAHPQPRIDPRPVIHPTPRIEPRLVYRPHRIETPPPPAPVPVDCETPRITKSPIQPPWKVLPWDQLPPPKPPLKVHIQPPDVIRTGTIFDTFA